MKTEKITIRINEDEKLQLIQMAKDKDVPVSQLVRDGIKTIIKESNNK